MVSELLHNDDQSPYWALWQISIGSMICMCCLVFLGLKLKWFRAQLRLGDSPSRNVESVPVQGVGFKMKSNPDDYQFYRVTSEFVSVSNTIQQKPIKQLNGRQNKNQIKDTNMTPVISKPIPQKSNLNPQSTISTKVIPKPPSQTINSSNPPSSTTNITKKPEIAQPESKPQSILKKQEAEEKQSTKKPTVNFEPGHVEITNPTAHNYSDLINNPSKQTEDDGEYEKQLQEQPKIKEAVKKVGNKQQTTIAKQPMTQIKNPLATQNFAMPMENEDDWKIKVVEEKPKQMKEVKEEKVDMMFLTSTKSNIYSSQAASIFFGGEAPEPTPRARKFVEMEEDNISTGSQTSA